MSQYDVLMPLGQSRPTENFFEAKKDKGMQNSITSELTVYLVSGS